MLQNLSSAAVVIGALRVNSLPPGKFFMLFCRLLIFFSKTTFSKISFKNTCTIRVSNSLVPDQARRSVRPDLGQNCLQKLSADDTHGDKELTLFPPDTTLLSNRQSQRLPCTGFAQA